MRVLYYPELSRDNLPKRDILPRRRTDLGSSWAWGALAAVLLLWWGWGKVRAVIQPPATGVTALPLPTATTAPVQAGSTAWLPAGYCLGPGGLPLPPGETYIGSQIWRCQNGKASGPQNPPLVGHAP